MIERKSVDWERLEADYRAGILSLREIASAHDITEGAIRKRAKRDGWERDLTEKVKAKAESLVRKELVRSQYAKDARAYSEQEIVDEGGSILAGIQIGHQKLIKRIKDQAVALLAELEAETCGIELFTELGDFLRSEDDRGQDRRNDLYQRVISSAGRVEGTKKIVEMVKILIGLEREAYGLSNDKEKDEGAAGLAARIEQARKRAQA